MTPPQFLDRISTWIPDAERRHHFRLLTATVAASVLLIALALSGFSYYTLDLPQRFLHPKHAQLRSSGAVGLRLGMLGAAMFLGLYLYPIRKRWKWLGRIGKTRHWLDFHILVGLTAPLVITFHSSFKLQGIAGVAYWIMIAVTVSGVVGRYLYAQIPRSLSAAELSLKELQEMSESHARELETQRLVSREELAPLLRLPPSVEVRAMSLAGVLAAMIWFDLRRLFLVGALRRRSMGPAEMLLTLGGLLPTGHLELETVVRAARRQSWIAAKILFLGRAHQVFHLWHVVHRPFSYSFAVLAGVHIGVVILLGYY